MKKIEPGSVWVHQHFTCDEHLVCDVKFGFVYYHAIVEFEDRPLIVMAMFVDEFLQCFQLKGSCDG